VNIKPRVGNLVRTTSAFIGPGLFPIFLVLDTDHAGFNPEAAIPQRGWKVLTPDGTVRILQTYNQHLFELVKT